MGNGATLSGAKTVPVWAWRTHPNGVYEMRPQRKGHYLLMLDGKVLPQQSDKNRLAGTDPAEGEWTYRNGSIFYKLPAGKSLRRGHYEFAADGVGVSLYNVRNVVIRNLNIQHFRVDGIHAHGLCKNVVMDNVTYVGNGRSGMAISGTSHVNILNCTFKGSRKHSVRVSGYARGKINQSSLDRPVTLR